jgi:dynein heavy chain, axonemal
VFRPDKFIKAIKDFVSLELGEKFVQPPFFQIQSSFSSSLSYIPLLFILPGSDPMTTLMSFADQRSIQLRAISLGQGQGIFAEKEIDDAKSGGGWVMLQNCHLCPSWMPKLEQIVEDLPRSKLHPSFRLWLSSYSSSDLPTSVIQSSIKITNEPPNGVKANLVGSYNSM